MSARDDDLMDEAWEEAQGIVLCTPALLMEALTDLVDQDTKPVDVESMLRPEFDSCDKKPEHLLAVMFGATDDKARLRALNRLHDMILDHLDDATRFECDKVLKRRADDMGERIAEMRAEARIAA